MLDCTWDMVLSQPPPCLDELLEFCCPVIPMHHRKRAFWIP